MQRKSVQSTRQGDEQVDIPASASSSVSTASSTATVSTVPTPAANTEHRDSPTQVGGETRVERETQVEREAESESNVNSQDRQEGAGVVVPAVAVELPPLQNDDYLPPGLPGFGDDELPPMNPIMGIAVGLALPAREAYTYNDSEAEVFFDDEADAADDDDLDDLYDDEELPPGIPSMPAFGLPPGAPTFDDDLPPGVPGFGDDELPPMNPILVRQNAYWRPGSPAIPTH